jgi:hypothetical protein
LIVGARGRWWIRRQLQRFSGGIQIDGAQEPIAVPGCCPNPVPNVLRIFVLPLRAETTYTLPLAVVAVTISAAAEARE